MRSAPVVGRAGDDVDVVVGQRVRHVAQQPRPVERLHLDRRHEDAVSASPSHSTSMSRSLCPRRQRHRVRAVGAVHRHAAATRDEADDLVAGHRRAAPRQPHHHVVEPLDVHARAVGALAAGAAWRTVIGSCSSSAPRPRAGSRATRWATRPRRDVVLADRGVQRVEVGVAHRDGRVRRARRVPTSFCTGRPSRRIALTSSSRPVSIASSRRSRENHWRILLRGAWATRRSSASRATGPRPRPSR